MDPHQDRLVSAHLAFDQGQMLAVIQTRAVQVQVEIAMRGRQADDFDALDQFLACPPVANQGFDGADLQFVSASQFDEFGQSAIDPSSLMISQ